MKYCYYCGAQLDDSAAFCGSCGQKVVDQSSPAAGQPEQQTYQPPYEQPQQPYQPPYEQPQQQPYQPPYQPAARGAALPQPNLVMCIIALALGATSLTLCWYGLVGLPFGIVGFIFGKKQLEIGFNKMAQIGKLLSLIGIITGAVSAVIWIIVYIVAAI